MKTFWKYSMAVGALAVASTPLIVNAIINKNSTRRKVEYVYEAERQMDHLYQNIDSSMIEKSIKDEIIKKPWEEKTYSISGLSKTPEIADAQTILYEYIGNQAMSRVTYNLVNKTGPLDTASVSVVSNRIIITGSSVVSMAHAFYQWAKESGYGSVDWIDSNNINIPSTIPDTSEKRYDGKFNKRLYGSTVSSGYTTTYFGYDEWYKFTNWLAIHGYNMTYVQDATEGIEDIMYKEFGLTDQQISTSQTGPSYESWKRLGNIENYKVNKNQDSRVKFNKRKMMLDKNVIKRMNRLGITPIVSGFSGYIPREMINKTFTIGSNSYKVTDKDVAKYEWNESFTDEYRPNLLSPSSDAYKAIAERFYEITKANLGNVNHFQLDLFNETDVPSKDVIRNTQRKAYDAMKEVNPESIWVIQGWTFGYKRNQWLSNNKWKELFSSYVPEDKMLVVDNTIDFNNSIWGISPNFKAFNNFGDHNFILSYMPNAGGRDFDTDIFDLYFDGFKSILNNNLINIYGYGTMPEGFKGVPIIRELISDAAWDMNGKTKRQWIFEYISNRYKLDRTKDLETTNRLVDSFVKLTNNHNELNKFSDRPMPNWAGQYTDYIPTSFNVYPSKETKTAIINIYKNLKNLIVKRGDTRTSLYEDFRKYASKVLSIKLQKVIKQNDNINDSRRLYTEMDSVLSNTKSHDIRQHIKMAYAWGDTEREANFYAEDRIGILTYWAPGVTNYASRFYSGIIKDYFLKQYLHRRGLLDGNNVSYGYDVIYTMDNKSLTNEEVISIIHDELLTLT